MAEELFKNVGKAAAEKPAPAPAKIAEDVVEVSPSGSPQDEPAVLVADTDEEDNIPTPDELTMLKHRASLMGIPYSNNIGVEALKAKIQAAIDGEPKEEEQPPVDPDYPEEQAVPEPPAKPVKAAKEVAPTNALTGEVKTDKALSLRDFLKREKLKLVRLRITCLDPKKKDLHGEIITIANEYLGTIRKFVPFGEATDNGYHVPYCIYETLKDRTFISIKTRKDNKGNEIIEHQNVKEFALEILDPLTSEEIARLAASQSAAGGL